MAASSGVTFSNSGAASNDIYETTEDQTAVYLVDVMSNDGGGAKTTLYSLDDGTGSYTTTGGVSILTDLLKQDNASSYDTTLYGAKISIVNGKVAVDPGTYSDVMKAKIQALGADDTLSDSFVYAIKMANGTLAWAKCTLTIRGANDLATITGATIGKIAEDGTTCVATGKLTVTDVDTGQDQARAAVVKSEFGTFTIDKSGSWIFAGDNLAMQKLAAGQQVPVSFKVWSLDGSASTTVVITITGTNDAPTVAAALKGEAVEGGAGVALNLLDGAKDGDDGAVLHADVNVDTLPAGVTFDALTNKLTLDPANGAYDHLAAGATQNVQVTYKVVDDKGATVDQTATFTITGTNDAPTVAAALKGEAVEGGAGVALNLLDGAKDGDDGAVLHADVNVDTLPAGVTFDALTNKLTLDPANGAYDHLAAGATQNVQVTYKVVDDKGATVDQTATFTITGTNDAPTVAAALKGEAVEGGAGVALNLLDGAKDGDDGAVLHADVNVDTLPAGVTFDALTNKLTLDPANGAYDHLAAGATQNVQVTYKVVDDKGATVDQTATFTITGTNDAPTVAAALKGEAVEGGAGVALNLLDGAKDGDDGAVLHADVNVDTLPAGVTFDALTNKLTLDPANGAYDHLAAGATQNVQVTYKVVDDKGATVDQTATFTITGTNDAPTVAAALKGEAVEGGAGVALNLLDGAKDGDDGAVLHADVNVDTLPAGVTFDALTNKLTLDPANGAYDHLAAGATQNVQVTYKVVDDKGATVDQTATFTITGTNDAPTVAAALKGEAVEGGAGVALNLLDGAKDGDDGAVLHADVNVDTLPAGVTFDALTNKLTLDPANGAYDHLAAGATQNVQVTYKVVDDKGATVDQTATFTITGTNDAPTVAAALKGEAVEGGAGVALNLLDGAKDGDDGAVLHADVNVDTLPAGVTFDALTNKLTLDPANGAYDHLAAGATQNVQVTYKVVDDKGATVDQTATFTITGTNDAPTVAAALKGEAVEGGAGVALNLLDGAKDGDDGAVLHADVNVDTLPAGVTFDALTNKLTLDPANGAYDHLAAGATQNVQVTYKVVDDKGATVDQTATFTITGTNDAPTVAAALKGEAVEGGAGVALNLLDGAKDGDDGAVLHADVNVDTLPAGVTFDALTNKLTLDPANGAYDHLAAGATQNVQVTYKVVDDKGATVDQTATFTITGTNDAPTVAAALKGEAVEGGAGVALNLLDGAKDGDDGAVLHADVNVDTLPAGVTFDALTNKLTLDPANGAYDHLAAGATQNVQVTYKVVDDKGATVDQTATFTITGTNDAPTVAAALKGEAVEGGAGVALNLLDGAKDGDDGAVLHADVNVDTLPAGVTFDALTNKLTLDPANGAYDHLAAGATQNVQVTYKVVDDKGATVDQTATFTITGTNDAGTISGSKTGAVTEDDTVFQATGQVVVSDKDDGQSSIIVQTGVSGKYGSFSISATGNWLYSLDNAKAETNALTSADHVSDSFTIYSADGTASSVSVTVSGHTDPATLPLAFTGSSDTNDYDDITTGVKQYVDQKDFNGAAGQTGYGDNNPQILSLGAGDDTYSARDGVDNISGGTGNDTIYGQRGNDIIHGDADSDLIYGGSGNDTLNGDDSADTIFGGSGMDVIQGGAGADRIVGGFGADTMDGGAGNDTFVFLDARDTNDIIDNFQVGADKLDFIDLFSGTLKLGTAHDGSLEAFSVNYFTSGSNTVVLVDLDGNTANGEFMVTLTGHHTLTTGEFLL